MNDMAKVKGSNSGSSSKRGRTHPPTRKAGPSKGRGYKCGGKLK